MGQAGRRAGCGGAAPGRAGGVRGGGCCPPLFAQSSFTLARAWGRMQVTALQTQPRHRKPQHCKQRL